MENFKNQEGLAPYFETAYGWVIFPTVAKGGVGFGGAYGQGRAYVRGQEDKLGDASLVQVSFGFQFGGQVYSEIIFFETEKDFLNFTQGNFEFGADAQVTALTASASASLSTIGNQGISAGLTAGNQHNVGGAACSYTKGASVFTLALGGLMYQATIAGQKFSYKAV